MNVMTIMVGKVCLLMVKLWQNTMIFETQQSNRNTIQRNIRLRKRQNKEKSWICVEEDREVVCIYVPMIDICLICPFSGVLTHFVSLLVQFLVRVNFNRLQRKSERSCIV